MADFPSSPKPQFVFVEQILYDVISSESESGKIYTSLRRDTPQRVFVVGYNALNQTDMETIRDHYTGQKMIYSPFNFTNPVDGQTYSVRYKNTLRITCVGENPSGGKLYRLDPLQLIEDL